MFAALRQAGFGVYLPVLAPESPCDAVIDDGTRLLRVQIKTGYVHANGSVRWRTCTTSFHRRGGSARSYRGVADIFAVWVPELAKCYLVPVDECGRWGSALRLSPARNNQRKKTRLAADYELRALTPPPRAVREPAAAYRALALVR